MSVRKYQDLIAWQKALELVAEVYRVTRTFPREEIYGLTGQMRRAAISVPSNIAEGQGRMSTGEFRQFLGQARGSLLELETQLHIAARLGYLGPREGEHLLHSSAEVGRVMNGLITSLDRASRHQGKTDH